MTRETGARQGGEDEPEVTHGLKLGRKMTRHGDALAKRTCPDGCPEGSGPDAVRSSGPPTNVGPCPSGLLDHSFLVWKRVLSCMSFKGLTHKAMKVKCLAQHPAHCGFSRHRKKPT